MRKNATLLILQEVEFDDSWCFSSGNYIQRHTSIKATTIIFPLPLLLQSSTLQLFLKIKQPVG